MRAHSLVLPVLLAVLAAPALAGCGSDDPADPGSTGSGSSATEQPEQPTEETPAAKRVDFCALLDPAAVGAVLGDTVSSKVNPSGGCDYLPDGRGPSATLDSLVEAETGGGYEVYVQGSAGATGSAAEPLSGIGEQAFVAAGTVPGFDVTSAAAGALVDGLIVTVNVAGGEVQEAKRLATELLELAVGAL